MCWLIGFCAGVLLCAGRATLPDIRILLLGIVLLGFWTRFLPRSLAPVLHLCLMLLVGLAYAGWRAELRLAQSLPSEWEKKPVTLVVVVRGLATQSADGSRFLAQVERVETSGARVPGLLRLSYAKAKSWPGGSRWKVTASLRARHATANPYGFDAEQWMWGHGVLASGTLRGRVESLEDATDLLARIDRLRNRMTDRIQRVLGRSRAAALISALTVGDQQGISRQDWQMFSRTGVTHLVSISGLHIGMVAGMAGWLARLLLQYWSPRRIPPRLLVSLCALLAAGSYALLAGWSVPTRRTFFMLAVAGGLLLWRRLLSPFQIWWLALSIVLLLDPFAVFLPGLYLSFGLVAALMLVVAGRRRGPVWWQAILLGQWASCVMSIVPLSVFFSALPLVSPLANLLAIPWVSVLLAPLSLLAVSLPFDGLLQLTAWLASGFLTVMAFMARAPVWFLPGIPWPLLCLAQLGALWLIAPVGLSGRSLGLLLLLPMFFHTPARPAPGAVWISVLDIGQGSSVLVRTARHSLLYDTGALAADNVVLPQLRGFGLRRLHALVLSHHDSDHDGAAAEIVRALPVEQILVGQAASAAGQPHTRCAPGQRWLWDGVQFEILGPLPRISLPGNNPQSCVLRIANAMHSLLLAGDIPVAVESMLVARYGSSLASTVLLAPHHGSKTSSSAGFLRVVAPQWAIVSAGYRNRYGHPHAMVLEQYRVQGCGILRTDLLGALEIRFERQLSISAYRQSVARYWRPR